MQATTTQLETFLETKFHYIRVWAEEKSSFYNDYASITAPPEMFLLLKIEKFGKKERFYSKNGRFTIADTLLQKPRYLPMNTISTNKNFSGA